MAFRGILISGKITKKLKFHLEFISRV